MATKTKPRVPESLESYPLRIPTNLKLWWENIALSQRRSLNSEIILLMEEARKNYKQVR